MRFSLSCCALSALLIGCNDQQVDCRDKDKIREQNKEMLIACVQASASSGEGGDVYRCTLAADDVYPAWRYRRCL